MSTQDKNIDEAILGAVTDEWAKIALVISKVFETPALQGTDGLGQKIAARIYILVDNGRLDSRGNMRRWRDGEVRLIPGKGA